ncbi:MAG TPA: hypothetical protein VI749_01985 [Candidatus Omnitrophota bacterium]|nr:hypothetical protein [Candidatus Omnitrophota bacterium]
MALTEKKIRLMLRWLHIVLGLVIMCYIYSPLHQYPAFQVAMKFFIIPTITASGLWIWKFKAFNRFLGIQGA